jgi:CheY-like chemotaxis protein
MTARENTVLLVDDDIDFVEVNRSALEAAGYHVIAAHDGAEALRLASQNPIKLAVIDVMMTTPEEGFELARKLRDDQRTRAVRLLMLTSVNQHNRKEGLLTFSDHDRDPSWLPVDRFIDKPVPPARLVELVREALA